GPSGFARKNPFYVWDAQPSPDGALIATTVNNPAQFFAARTGQPVGKPMPHRAPVYTARFSPNGKRLATGSHDSTARVWSVPSGDPITPELVHEQRVMIV